MEIQDSNGYFIWGLDDAPYGPVELPVLMDWIKDERVFPDTWVFARANGVWQKASDMPALKDCFGQKDSGATEAISRNGFKPGSLRRIKILANLSDAQLAHLAEFMELQACRNGPRSSSRAMRATPCISS